MYHLCSLQNEMIRDKATQQHIVPVHIVNKIIHQNWPCTCSQEQMEKEKFVTVSTWKQYSALSCNLVHDHMQQPCVQNHRLGPPHFHADSPGVLLVLIHTNFPRQKTTFRVIIAEIFMNTAAELQHLAPCILWNRMPLMDLHIKKTRSLQTYQQN
jgi:hypothetical protein